MFDLFESIEDWIKDLLTGFISSNLTTMFTDVNDRTGTIAAEVGQTPQGWNGGIFSMIQNLSNSVIIPIAGLIITFPVYLLARGTLGTSFSACLMVVLMLPFFFFAMYEKDGRPLEKILMNIWRARVQRPGIRIYQTDNLYAAIQQQIYDKEVLGIGEGQEKRKAAVRSRQQNAADRRKNKDCR